MHLVGHVLAGEGCERLGGCDLHRLVDGAGAHIQRAAEDIREAENVVDLVRIVAAAGGDDGVRAGGTRFLRRDFRVGVGHGEDDGLGGHAAHHILRDGTADGEAEDGVGAFKCFGQRARRRCWTRGPISTD